MPNLNVGLGLALCCVNTASAYLQVSAGSAVGTYCYSDWEYPGDLLVVACECDAKGYTVDDCSTSAPDGTCYLGSSGGLDAIEPIISDSLAGSSGKRSTCSGI